MMPEFSLGTIIKIFSLLLEVFLGQLMLCKILTPKTFRLRIPCITGIFCVHAIFLLIEEYYLPKLYGDVFWLYILLHAIFLILFAFVICEGRASFKFFLPLIYISILLLCRFPFSILLNLLSHILPDSIIFTLHSYNKSLLPSILLVLCGCFFIRFRPNTKQNYPFSYYMVMILTPILNSCTVMMLKNYFDAVSGVINYIGTFSLVSELLLYYMVWQMTSEYSSRIQLQLINQQNDYQKQHMKDLNTIVTEYHHLRHDTKNHFACMDRLLSQNKYDALKEYFYNLSKEIYALDNQIETGNEIVNQVINLKYATAHKYQIPMDIQIVLPPHLSIPDHHLCSLVANLLDNAIEASRKIEDPKIVIEMKMVKDYLSLTIRNKMDPSMQDKALTIRTTKADKKQHGLGRQIIDDIVRRYNGISTREIKDGWYIASVMLELGAE